MISFIDILFSICYTKRNKIKVVIVMKQILGDLNMYKVFYVVAKSKTFSEAAKKLYISQPAISYSIKTLEKQLGFSLFCRNTKKITLTFEGNEILNQVETAYNLILSAEAKLQDIANLNCGNISIGTPSHIGSSYLLNLIKEFKKGHPKISFDIINKSTHENIKLLYNKSIDMVIDTMPITMPHGTTHSVIKKLSMCFATCPELYHEKVYNKYDISNGNLILPSKGTSTRDLIDDVFESDRIVLKPSIQITTTDMTKQCVFSKFGIGLFIRETILDELENGTLKEIKTDFKLPEIDLCLVYYPENLSLSSKEFITSYILHKY